MLEIDVFTLFPEAFAWLSETRPLRNATEAGQLRLRVLDLRDHALGGYRQVDDAPYGGGAGMLIRVDVVCTAGVRVIAMSRSSSDPPTAR